MTSNGYDSKSFYLVMSKILTSQLKINALEVKKK